MVICKTCKIEKTEDGFFRQKAKKNGLQSECKACMKIRNNNWQRANHAQRHADKVAGIVASRQKNQKYAWLKGVKERAIAKGMEFDLTGDDILVPEYCPVLGIKMQSRMGFGRKKGDNIDASPSLDRLDNSKGYIRGNVSVISYRANRIKSDASVEELRAIVRWFDESRSREKT